MTTKKMIPGWVGSAFTNGAFKAMKAQIFFAFLVAAPLLASADAVRVYDVDDYVQRGLITHFDGIRNVGTNAVHDSTAAGWTNLVARQPHAEFVGDTGSWADSGLGYYFKGTGSAYAMISDPGITLGKYATIQLALDATPSDNTAKYTGLFRSLGDISDNLSFWIGKSGTEASFKEDAYTGNGNSGRPYFNQWDGEYVTAILGAEYSYLFQGTVPVDSDNGRERNTFGEVPQATYSFGGSDADNRKFKGVYHSVRIYNVELTTDELVHNRVVDDARYRNEATKGKGNDDVNVVVASNVEGFEGAEECGKWYIPEGTHTFTATASVFVGKKGYAVTGYTVEEWNDSTSTWGEAVTHSGASYTASSSSAKVRLTWLWTPILRTADVDDYVDYGKEDLILHFDGIRNAGATAAHSTNATTWVNLGSLGSAQDATLATLGSHVSDDATNGKWGDTSYWFGGKNYFDIGGTVALGGAVTAQLVTDFTSKPQVASYPIFLGATSNDADNFAVYSTDKAENLYIKFFAGSYPSATYSGSGFVNAIYDSANSQVSIGEAAAADWQTTSKSGDVSEYSYAIGTAHKTDYYNASKGKWKRMLVGNVHAVRVYTRVLEDTELAKNREIDEIRFYGNVTVVNGEIGETGENGECSLSGGVYNLDSGTWTVTASDCIRDGRRYSPRLTVETLTEDGEWVRTNRIWTDSYTIDKSAIGSGRIRLTWTWEIRNGLIISFY